MFTYPMTSVTTGKTLAPISLDDADIERVMKIAAEVYPNEEVRIHQPEFTPSKRSVYKRLTR